MKAHNAEHIQVHKSHQKVTKCQLINVIMHFPLNLLVSTKHNKNLGYYRGTTRWIMSVEILSIT